MKPNKLYRRWQRRCTALLDQLLKGLRACRARGDGEEIHQVRVVLRRLRLYVRIGRPLIAAQARASLRLWARGVAEMTGHVRDYDVALEWLAANAAGRELAARLAPRRDRVWQRWRRRLPRFPPKAARALRQPESGPKAASRLADRFARRLAVLHEQVRSQMPAFFGLAQPEQHDFRRAVRWWRYLQELKLPQRRQGKDPLLKALIRVQEALGESQNRAVTAALLHRLQRLPDAKRLSRQLASEQQQWLAKTGQAFKALAKEQSWKPIPDLQRRHQDRASAGQVDRSPARPNRPPRSPTTGV